MNTTLDLNKVRMYKQTLTNEKFNVIVDSRHEVDGVFFVIAKRVDKPGLVRLAASTIEEIK